LTVGIRSWRACPPPPPSASPALPAASAGVRIVGIDQMMKAGPDGNHGFLLRRAVHIRQSAWGVAPRHPRRRLTGLAPWPSGILRSACSADRLASDTTRRRNVVRSQRVGLKVFPARILCSRQPMTLAPGFSNEASIIRNAEVADPGIVRHANEAQTRDRGTNGPGLTGKMMHRAVAPGPGYSAAIAMPGSRQGAARSPPPRRAAPSSPAATAGCPTHRWTHDRCR